ncbi:MAG: hypothetical protein GDA41_03035 [Rhodospirillales bacterium]|nr:hypothetical protein [Rhodospirillales bacterium]
MAQASGVEPADPPDKVWPGLDRRIWTPILIVGSLLAGWARMIVITPGQMQMDGQLANATYLFGIFGSALMPWAIGLIALYAYWLWCKARRSANFMRSDFPRHSRRVVHRMVLFLVLLMGLEALADAALRLDLI